MPKRPKRQAAKEDSIMVHFGSLEEVLKQAHTNRGKKELDAAIKDVPVEKAEEALQSLSYS